MLERTARCLESGSLRRIVPGSKNSLKSRRALHSAFWNHGAAEIELSPLWAALLRGPGHVDDERETQQQKSSIGGGGVLLDFLYPTGTMNFLRQYSGWGADRPDARRGQFGLLRFGHRLYTSSAKDSSNNDKNSGGEVGAESTPDTSTAKSSAESLQKLFGLTKTNDYDEAWRQFLLLDESARRRLRRGLIEYLNPSTSIVDAERTIGLFDMLPEEDRESECIKSSIRSYLRLRNLSDAITLYESAVHRLAYPAGADELLAYMVENTLWSRAFTLFQDIQGLGERNPLTRKFRFWGIVKKLPRLSIRCFELVDFVDQRMKSSDSSNASSADLLEFAAKMIRCALFNDTFELNQFERLLSTLQKWNMDTSTLYDDAIGFLLNSKQSSFAVKLYRRSRQKPHRRLSRPTLHSILKIFCDHQSIIGMQQILDDFFRFYTVPSRSAYKMCMKVFAAMGDADTVHALFEQFIHRFVDGRKFNSASDLGSILNVHAKRGEIDEVIRHFNEMEGKYGMKPDLLCWNILLHAYGRVNDVDGAFSCFEDLLATGLKPDAYTFGTLMGVCVSHGDLERTVEIYRLADKMNIEKSNGMVDCLVLAHIQDERLLEAEKICEEALSMDLRGSQTRMWNQLLTAHALRRDLVNVNRILRRMSDADIAYGTFTYSALMLALAMVKQPSRAYDILREVMKDAGVKPTNFHYAVVMGGYIATNEFHMVHQVHKSALKRMEQRGIRPSSSTKLLMMKAVHKEDERLFATGALQEQSDRAFEMFQEVVGSMEPMDNAMTPRKGDGRMATDISYPTMFYNYILFILAQRDEHATVEELYQQYSNILQQNKRDDIPPINILSALVISKLRAGDYKSVQKCWDLALSKAISQGVPLKLPGSITERIPPSRRRTAEPKVLARHQMDLQVILGQYMKSLAKQRQIDRLITVVNDLLDQGFLLSNSNWNQYIGYLAKNLRFKLAFELCETKLMDGWTGWARIRWQLPERNALPIEVRHLRKDPKYLRPIFHTFLYLGRCYLELQEMSAESRGSQSLLEVLEHDCPRTLRAIRSMQRIDDDFERSILTGNNWADV